MHLLLIIDCYLPSTKSAAQLADDLARGIIARGHEITILAPSDALESSLTVSDAERLHVVRYKSGRIKDVNRVVRAINEMLISLVAYFRTRRYMAGRGYDGIVFYSPSIFFGPLVYHFKRRFKARAFLILRDIFPDWAVNAGVLRKGPVYYVFKMFEHIQYRAADVIGVETSRSIDYFQPTAYVDKVELLRNWTRTDPPPRGERSYRSELGLEGKIVFFYGGNIGVAQDMDNLMRLAKRMADRPDVHFLFVGDGSEVPRLKKMVADEGMDNTTIHPPVDPDTYMAMLSEFDVGLITLDRRLKTYSNTGKILGYMRCGLPILASYNPGNDLEELLRDSEAGLGSVNGEGDDVLLGNALTLCDPAERRRMGANSRKLLDEVFAVDKIAGQILAGCARGR